MSDGDGDGQSRWVDISVESEFGCAVERSGVVFCWGRDPGAAMAMRELPEQVTAQHPAVYGPRKWGPASALELIRGARRVSTASSQVCAIVEDGRVRCWGSVRWGAQHVYDVPGITHAVELEISDGESCAAVEGGELWCWNTENFGVPRRRLDGAIAMAISDGLACGLTGQGDVVCWGQAIKDWHRYERQFNQQPQTTPPSLQPQLVPDPAELPDILEIGRFRGATGLALSGWNNLCVLRADAKLACSSKDVFSLLHEKDLGMQALDGATGLAAVVTTRTHACARTLDGHALCWGRNVYGQLGDGASTSRESAAPVAALEDVLDISVAENFSCALTRDDRIACWGFDLGEGLGHELQHAHTLADLSATSIAASGHTTCAVDKHGALRCWGGDMLEQTGIARAATPTAITLPSTGEILGFSTGLEACFLLSGGALECGMWNAYGSTNTSFTPSKSVPDVSAFAAGAPPLCAIMGHGRSAELSCGQSFGQLSVERQIKTPRAVSASHMRGCVVHSGGQVSCFGELYFWNDHTQTPPLREFTRLEGIRDAVAVASSSAHDCALRSAGHVSCWIGRTETEWREDGQTPKANHYRASEAKDLGLERVSQLVAGSQHHCALISGGIVRCWTDNPYGEATLWRPVPALGDVVELAAGSEHTCARMSTGAVTCWGEDVWGQLGRVPSRVHLRPTTMPIE
jgi:alpha-tubulin suppressor-like RCC1 family protein